MSFINSYLIPKESTSGLEEGRHPELDIFVSQVAGGFCIYKIKNESHLRSDGKWLNSLRPNDNYYEEYQQNCIFRTETDAFKALVSLPEVIALEVKCDDVFFEPIDLENETLCVGWDNPNSPQFKGIIQKIFNDEHTFPLYCWLSSVGWKSNYLELRSSDDEDYHESFEDEIDPSTIDLPEGAIPMFIVDSEEGIYLIYITKIVSAEDGK